MTIIAPDFNGRPPRQNEPRLGWHLHGEDSCFDFDLSQRLQVDGPPLIELLTEVIDTAVAKLFAAQKLDNFRSASWEDTITPPAHLESAGRTHKNAADGFGKVRDVGEEEERCSLTPGTDASRRPGSL